MSGHMATFIQYVSSTTFPQFIGQAILHQFYWSKKNGISHNFGDGINLFD